MKSTLLRDFLTGLTAVVGLAGLIITLMIIGDLGGVVQSYYELRVNLVSASGLNTSSMVTLNGVRIGQVTHAEVRLPPAVGAELRLRVRSEVKVPRVVRVSIDKGLIGDGSLELSIPATATAAELSQVYSANDVIEGGEPLTLVGQIAGVVKDPLERIGKAADKIDALADEYTKAGKRLNELLEPRTLADVKAGKEPNVRSTIERLDRALEGADAWLHDEALSAQVHDAVRRAGGLLDEASGLMTTWRQTGESARKSADAVGEVAADVKEQFRAVSQQAVSSLQKIDGAAGELSGLLGKIDRGEGTLGQLSQNPDLYNSLRDASNRLEKALAELQLLLEKYKAEGIKLNL